MRWDAWARGRGHARPYVRRWPRRGPTIPPPKESLKRGGERPYGPSRARNFPQCRSSGGPGAAVCIEAAAPTGRRWAWCPIRTPPKQQEFFLTARRGRGCAGTFRTGGRGYSESGGVYSGADRRGQRPQDGPGGPENRATGPCHVPVPARHAGPRDGHRKPRAYPPTPGQGGALPWGSVAVPLLGGSMPRAAAPRMAAHRPSSTPGKAYPIPHPKKV